MKTISDMSFFQGTEVQTRKSSKLADAAQQFEASMLQELLKPLQDSKEEWGGDDSDHDNSSDTLNSFGVESITKTLAKEGGFGIAKHVISQVNREYQRNATKKTE